MTDEDKVVYDRAMDEVRRFRDELLPFFEAAPPMECFICGHSTTHGWLNATTAVCDACYAECDV